MNHIASIARVVAARCGTTLSLLAIVAVASLAALPGAARAQQQLTGTTTVINNGPGDQINPHVDCNVASYTNDTGVQDIHYFDFSTNTDHTIPTVGLAFLSDVSGTRVAYTNVTGAGSQIAVFDTITGTSTTIPGGTQRTNPSIGGNLVAFEDRSFSTDPNQSEIVLYDLTAGTTTRLTNDALMDTNPSVSPNGNAVVWQKCQTTGFGCDIFAAVETAPGVFTTTQLTGGAGEDRNPATNGSVVVYTSIRNGEANIFYQPSGGGTETQLSLTGEQRDPSISGNLIAFESQVGTEFDIFVYDITTGTLYRVTNTPVDETLSDISVCNGVGRIVYSAPGANGDFDVFAFTFTPPASGVSFASLSAKADITRGPAANDDRFDINGTFTLGTTSNGINPLTEAVTVQVGPVSETIPPGSFTRDRQGRFKFTGVIGGVALDVVIVPTSSGQFQFMVEGSGAELSTAVNPVTIALQIGDDRGSTTVQADIH